MKSFRDAVVSHGEFTKDWFTSRIDTLEPFLRELEGRNAQVLEIGSFEGLSACYFLWRLPLAALTCIDTFRGSPGTPSADRPELEAVFDRNVARVDAVRVRKLVGTSSRLLLDLADEGRSFDLVYVDGSHRALDVVVDAALSWPLVAVGGLVVFDDYRWSLLGDDPFLRPGLAIDGFLGLLSDRGEVVVRDHQVIVRKLAGA